MDSSGHWHNATKLGDINEELKGTFPGRKVIEIGIGEKVNVVKNGGDFMRCTFDAAEKNRVTLTPTGEGERPYFELAEQVQLQRDNGENIRAQVWDNRNSKLILRTLPQ